MKIICRNLVYTETIYKMLLHCVMTKQIYKFYFSRGNFYSQCLLYTPMILTSNLIIFTLVESLFLSLFKLSHPPTQPLIFITFLLLSWSTLSSSSLFSFFLSLLSTPSYPLLLPPSLPPCDPPRLSSSPSSKCPFPFFGTFFFFFLFRGSFLLIYFFIESSVIDLFFFVLLYLLLLSISTIFFLSFFSPTFYCYSMNNNLFKKKIMQIYRVFFSKKWHEDLEKYFIVWQNLNLSFSKTQH